MTRRPDWPNALRAFADRVVGRPFAWGDTDCGSIVRRAVESMYHPAPDWHVLAYHNRREARQVLSMWAGDHGLRAWCGATVIPVEQAVDGDVIRWERPAPTGSWGVVLDRTLLTSAEGAQVVRLPLGMALRLSREPAVCWRMP